MTSVISYLLTFLSLHINYIKSTVNIATDGEIWYCNSNPSNTISISPLSSSDLQRINKLEQVQVMTRHGTRTSHKNLQDYFPNNTQYYQCDISTITSRINTNNNINNYNKYFIPMIQTFEYDNQLLLHSNCQMEQSWPILINQQQQNTQILINAYMNSNNPSQLFDIKLTNKQLTTLKYIKLYTSNKERCMLSTVIIASKLLNISAYNETLLNPLIETITNDFEFNPYAPWENIMCNAKEQYKSWHNQSMNDIFNNYITPKQKILSEKYKNEMNEYVKQGGIIVTDPFSFHEHPGFRIANFYCNGMDIPLTPMSFRNLIEIGKEYASIQPIKLSDNKHENKYEQKYKCIYKFMTIPMYKRFLDNIYSVINGDINAKKFILHSAHDSSIISFLSGLNMHDGIPPYFAQFMTLELYSANIDHVYNKNNNIKYLFRFTHKGMFIPYEYCYDEYNN
eukprot:517719_1